MIEALVDAWRINNRICVYFVDALTPEQWAVTLAKGKAVQKQFAHIHNVRLMWVKAAAPELMEGLAKVEDDVSKEDMIAALNASSEAVAKLIESAGSADGRIKNFKPHAAGFLAYMAAHEGFHRGHAEVALRQAGLPLPDKIAYGQWEWGSR